MRQSLSFILTGSDERVFQPEEDPKEDPWQWFNCLRTLTGSWSCSLLLVLLLLSSISLVFSTLCFIISIRPSVSSYKLVYFLLCFRKSLTDSCLWPCFSRFGTQVDGVLDPSAISSPVERLSSMAGWKDSLRYFAHLDIHSECKR